MKDDLENLEDEIKDDIEEKDVKKNLQNNKREKGNSKILKIGLGILIVVIWSSIGYFVYSKFIAKDKSEDFVNDTVTQEVVEEIPVEKVSTNDMTDLASLGNAINENAKEEIVEEPVVETSQESQETVEKENNVQVNDDNYDLVVLETVYDEVINKGNEAYLYNFSKNELAIIRNTLYARKGYKFKKKEYQRYFGEKSWYNPTTSSQNVLTRNEERLANIIKRYE